MTSINNKSWLEKIIPNNFIELLMQQHNISYVVAKIILSRGFTIVNSTLFFNTKLKTSMPNPYTLQDLDKAVHITKEVILTKSPICILGDYDVDGITSTAMLYKYFNKLGIPVSYYIPNRFNDGYGGSLSSINNILTKDPKLVIMVDNGSSSYELVEELVNKDIKVVILDHHSIEPNMPSAHAVVNPARLDDISNLNYLCSAGLVFLYLISLNRALESGKNINTLTNTDLLSYLDLVALATVCDMVPLKALNRTYVIQGLKVLAKKENIGLKCLLEVLNFNDKITSDTLGFTLGPAINAASRMGKEHLAIELLTADNESEALQLSIKLKEINLQRQEAENIVIKSVTTELELNTIKQEFIFVGSHNWSQGIIGIIAGRIKEMHNKPTCVYSVNLSNNTATASGRSLSHINLGDIVIAARQQGLLIKGGGHSQAVGFTFDLKLKDNIFEFFNKNINLQSLRKKISNDLYIDHTLALSAINSSLVKQLSELEPFGVSFNEPLFKIPSVFISNVKTVGRYNNHLTFDISDGLRKIKGICFKALPSPLGSFLLTECNKPLDIIAHVKGNFYKGNIYPNLVVIDINS